MLKAKNVLRQLFRKGQGFLDPELRVRLGRCRQPTAFMTMPVAPIHKDRSLSTGYDDVRTTWQSRVIQSIPDADGTQEDAYHLLRFRVDAPDPGHVP